jgi:elongation factor P
MLYFCGKKFINMADTGDLFKGCFIRYNGELVQVLEYEHRTPGNLRAFYQVKMRNVKTGRLVENRFRAGETIDLVRVDVVEYNVLYRDGDSFVCMNNETYEQINIDRALFGDSVDFIKEGLTVKISFDGETPVAAEPPLIAEYTVVYTEPGVKGDTATKAMKPAILDTGAKINVPLFIDKDEKIKVNLQTKEYVERVK